MLGNIIAYLLFDVPAALLYIIGAILKGFFHIAVEIFKGVFYIAVESIKVYLKITVLVFVPPVLCFIGFLFAQLRWLIIEGTFFHKSRLPKEDSKEFLWIVYGGLCLSIVSYVLVRDALEDRGDDPSDTNTFFIALWMIMVGVTLEIVVGSCVLGWTLFRKGLWAMKTRGVGERDEEESLGIQEMQEKSEHPEGALMEPRSLVNAELHVGLWNGGQREY